MGEGEERMKDWGGKRGRVEREVGESGKRED